MALKQSLFRLEFGAERNAGALPEGDFTQNLYSTRLELKFSPDLQLSSFVQYDNESESVGSNTASALDVHAVRRSVRRLQPQPAAVAQRPDAPASGNSNRTR